MSFTHAGRTLSKVAVIGSGQIGPDIALYFAKVLSPFGVQTVVVDVSEDALAKGKAKLEKKVAKGVESNAFTPDQQKQMVGSLTWTSDYGKIAGAELVVEAATENKELKGKIFAQVEGLVGPDAILVSNSSHLEPEVIFANTKKKDRTGVVHYFFLLHCSSWARSRSRRPDPRSNPSRYRTSRRRSHARCHRRRRRCRRWCRGGGR